MQQDSYKYWAFISYSHRDQAWAEWLHKALETYRVPRRLVGRETAAGPVPRRLFPVFRDLEELPSSPNLSGAIDQALLQSRYLIVIASPYAAVSKWVDQEIARFRALGRGDRILCLIVDGEPHADRQPGRGFLECFPPSLRIEDGIEPIAADVRPGKDGRPAAKLKLIAGLLGVGLDELRRRERRRRILQNMGVVAVSLLSALILAGLWQMQQREKREALAQQEQRTHIETVYEKGRQELLAHNQARAAVYLNEAYRLGVDTPALRFMLAQAMRIVERQWLAFQTGAAVTLLKFSPDASELYTRGSDDVARVWDTRQGRKLFDFPIPIHALRTIRFSRSGKFLTLSVVPNDAPTAYLRIMDARTGEVLGSLVNAPTTTNTLNMFDWSGSRVVHLAPDRAAEIVELSSAKVLRRLAGPYSIVGFSRDGRRVFTGRDNGEVILWNADASRKLRTFTGLQESIEKIDDTEDGTLLAAASRDGAIRTWQVSDGALRVFGGHPSPNPWLIFNLDGTRLFTGADDGVRVWNTANGALVYALQYAGTAGNRFDISSDGRWLLSSNSSRLTMQDVQSGAELFTLDGHRGLPGARDISDNDGYIATGGSDGRAVLWKMPRLADFELRHVIDPLRWNKRWSPGVAAVYSNAGDLVATGAADGQLKFWDARSHQLIRSVEADPQSVNLAEFSADDRRILSAGESSGVKIWEVNSGHLLHVLDVDGKEVLSAAFSRDGRYVAATSLTGVTRIWNGDSGELLGSFEDKGTVSSRFSPDGRGLVLGFGGSVRFWDIDRRQFVWEAKLQPPPDGHESHASAFDFSANGKKLLVARNDGVAFVLDAGSGEVLQSMHEASASDLLSARFDPSSERVVLSDNSGLAIIWRPGDGHTWLLHGHAGRVLSAEFSPDGKFVLTSGIDATARIWDASNGELLDILGQHSASMPETPFHAASFSPDGHKVLTGSIDGVVREWQLREEPRNSVELDAILQCRAPWRVEGENLVPFSPKDSACPAI